MFASLVDDPDSDPQYHKANGAVDEDCAVIKRADLFNLIEELVMWEIPLGLDKKVGRVASRSMYRDCHRRKRSKSRSRFKPSLPGARDKLVRDVTENWRILKFTDYGFEER